MGNTARRDGHVDDPAVIAPLERIDSSLMPAEACFTDYHDSSRDVYDVATTTVAPDAMQMQVVTWPAGPLEFSTFRASEHRVVRTARHLRRSPLDCLRVRLYRGGVTRAILDDRPVTMSASAIHVLDYACEADAISTDVDQISVYLPHEAIGYDPARHPRYWRIGLATPRGRLITNALTTFGEAVPGASPETAETMAAALQGLLAGALSGDIASSEERTFRSCRARAMRDHIDRHLDDRDLGVATLARAFGASRATIFRDFAEDGGVERYIQRRRLDRAYVRLCRTPGQRGAVQRIAEDLGFLDASHFNRAFRRQFGHAPGAVLGSRMPVDAAP